jgi:hypothetical protein
MYIEKPPANPIKKELMSVSKEAAALIAPRANSFISFPAITASVVL